MKKFVVVMLLVIMACVCFGACATVMPDSGEQNPPSSPEVPSRPSVPEPPTEVTNMRVVISGTVFRAQLYDNATARAFARMLPMTISMGELNGNEKYNYLPSNLPTDATRPGTLVEGDLMLYGSNCFVLFYETFSSSYSYSKIGKISDTTNLARAVGRGNITITFSAEN